MTDDYQLVQRILQKDEAAFEALYETYAPALLRRLHRMLGDEEQAEECLQQVFVEALHSFKNYRAEGALGAWLNRIATHTVMGLFRRHHRTRAFWEKFRVHESINPPPPKLPEGLLLQEELRTLVQEMLKKIGPRKRLAVILCDIEGHSLEEAAKEMDIPMGTVASRLYHGRRELKKLIAQELKKRGLSIRDFTHG